MKKKSDEKPSVRDQWATPWEVYLPLAAEFNIGLDVCATAQNHKAPIYLTPEMDGLTVDWQQMLNTHCAPGQAAWANPPYSNMWDWSVKAKEEADKGAVVVFLGEARQETAWFRHLALVANESPDHDGYGELVPNADIRFVYPRIPFLVPDGITQKSQTGHIGSVVVILGTGIKQITWYDWKLAAKYSIDLIKGA